MSQPSGGKFTVGTTVYYLDVDRWGRKTRKRRPAQMVGTVVGQRDARGAWVRWRDGSRGSVLWDWIAAKPPQPSGGRPAR